jgi:membrane protein
MAWIDLLKLPWEAGYRLVMEDEGLELSGHIAFTTFTSLFPFLIFLAALAGFLGDQDTADGFIRAMFQFMPDDVAATLAPAVREVIGSRQGGLLTFGILTTLWFSSSGVEALRAGLNRAYGVREERAIWWLRLQSLAFVIVGALIIFFLSLAVILGPIVWDLLRPLAGIGEAETQLVWTVTRYLLATALLWGALMLLHRWLPNTKQAFRRVLPGVCATGTVKLLPVGLQRRTGTDSRAG